MLINATRPFDFINNQQAEFSLWSFCFSRKQGEIYRVVREVTLEKNIAPMEIPKLNSKYPFLQSQKKLRKIQEFCNFFPYFVNIGVILTLYQQMILTVLIYPSDTQHCLHQNVKNISIEEIYYSSKYIRRQHI